jgi:saccharopine dehydrogenase (NAD+, L-lysine forming)
MTMATVGIRREDKNDWERRVPLTPAAVRRLVDAGIRVVVQPSHIRVFADDEYRAAGADVREDLSGCGLVVAVKEIPTEHFRADTAYVFFSHTIKGQAHNMALLRALLSAGATLIDYERVVDAHGRRLIHFGRFAGIAGAVDGLWTLGRRLLATGIETPLLSIGPAWSYHDLAEAMDAVTSAGDAIRHQGVPGPAGPLVIGVTGYGNVAGGVNEVLGCLPVVDVAPEDLSEAFLRDASDRFVHRVTFLEEHTAEPVSGTAFDLDDYRRSPEQYRSTFARFLPHLSMLVNAIYWDERAPRLAGRGELEEVVATDAARLQVIADLSCDIDGGIEGTVRVTTPDDPVYVYDPATGVATDGVDGRGVVILAVDHLPCELPRDSSESFSDALEPWIPSLAAADFTRPFDRLGLPPQLLPAVVAHQGRLAPDFEYLAESLTRA